MDQIKTVQGRVPVTDVWFEDTNKLGRLHFALKTASDAASEEEEARHGGKKRREPTIEDLALLWDQNFRVHKSVLSETALLLGPLFGESEYERMDDWLTASIIAKDVISLQEAINGNMPLASIGQLESAGGGQAGLGELVAKTYVKNVRTGNGFTIYAMSFDVFAATSKTFFRNMPVLPCFRKFCTPELHDYVFMDLENDEEGRFLTVTLFAFQREITALDFAAAVMACGGDDVDSTLTLLEQAAAEVEFSFDELPANFVGLLSSPGSLEVEERALDEGDVPHLQKLVHAVISLHLQGISIDIFRSAESDDFMVFPTYLGFLWYRFSKKLGQVKIGYCEQCGRSFSLTGHRGIARSYCSEECKTRAKNARTKRQRDEARRLFMEEGLGVQEVALQVYAEELSSEARSNKRKTPEQAQQLVRKSLAEWPVLKREADADLQRGGGSPFVQRLRAEGVFTDAQIVRRARELGLLEA